MRDDLPYFSHDNDARNHPKMKALRARFGWTGYGQFWALNEMIAGSAEARLNLSRKVVRAATACELGMTTDALDEFLKFLADPNECGLILYESGVVTTDRTQEDFSRVNAERDRKRGFGKTSAEKRESSAEKLGNSAEAPRKNPTDKSRVDKTREEERREEKEDPLDFPDDLPSGVPQKHVYANPNESDVSSRFEVDRAVWAAHNLVEFRRSLVNLKDYERADVLTTYKCYSASEVADAIDQYAKVLASPDHDHYPYKTLVSFLAKGVEQYISAAKPWETKRSRVPGPSKTAQDFSRYDALMQGAAR